jgi:Tfp pilus assembly protein PilV
MRNSKDGFNLVEVLLAMATFSLLITAIVGALIYGQQSTQIAGTRARASLLAEEGIEAVRNIRDENFTNLTDGHYGLSTAGGKWSFNGAADTTGVFTRTLIISTVDANTKQVVSQVTWQENQQRDGLVALTGYITNWKAGP